jgi:hypothetical protein
MSSGLSRDATTARRRRSVRSPTHIDRVLVWGSVGVLAFYLGIAWAVSSWGSL